MTTPSDDVTVLIIDDHVLFAEALGAALEETNLHIVGVAETGEAGVAQAIASRPNIVLVDLGLPDGDGVDFGKQIIEALPSTKVVALTGLIDPKAGHAAIRAGFNGFLTKSTALAQLTRSIIAIAGGEVVTPLRNTPVASTTLSGKERDVALQAAQLTEREQEVLQLLVEGAMSTEIAERLSITLNTVRTHIQNVLAKLQVHSRLEAVAFAVRAGLIKPSGR